MTRYTTTFTVSGRTLRADLTQWMTADVVFFGGLSQTLVLDCGSTTTIGNIYVDTMPGGSGIELSSFRCG